MIPFADRMFVALSLLCVIPWAMMTRAYAVLDGVSRPGADVPMSFTYEVL